MYESMQTVEFLVLWIESSPKQQQFRYRNKNRFFS